MAAKAIWFNGKLVPPEQASLGVYDHGVLYGDGVFEGIRVYSGKVLKMRTHLMRLFDGARTLRLDIPYTIEELEQAIRDTVAANPPENDYVRLCVTRGPGTLGLHPFKCSHPNTIIIADHMELYPPDLYQTGMRVVTAKRIRNHPDALPPSVKSMNYLNNILAKIEAIDAGVLEALMLNHDGQVCECTGDNVFLVTGQVLITPPLDAGILEGVTRGMVLDMAQQAGIHTEQRIVLLDEVYSADEMFLTGTAAELIPVTQVDDRTIGAGNVGPITRQLTDAFREMVSDPPED